MKTALKILFVLNLVCLVWSVVMHILYPAEWDILRMIRNMAVSAFGAAVSYMGWRV